MRKFKFRGKDYFAYKAFPYISGKGEYSFLYDGEEMVISREEFYYIVGKTQLNITGVA